VKQAEGAAKPLESMRKQMKPWKGDRTNRDGFCRPSRGFGFLVITFQGLRFATLAHPWLQSDAPPGLAKEAPPFDHLKISHFGRAF
jgi:hypothetical protein